MEIICGWTPLQQLLMARRSLSGTVHLRMRAERPHKTWKELKAALSKEFPDTVDIKAIHELMSQCKKKRDDSCIDYMIVMKKLGKRGKLPDYVAIKYIVDGIIDHETNQIMLYDVTTYPDLKEKFKIYETIKEKMKVEHSRSNHRNEKRGIARHGKTPKRRRLHNRVMASMCRKIVRRRHKVQNALTATNTVIFPPSAHRKKN